MIDMFSPFKAIGDDQRGGHLLKQFYRDLAATTIVEKINKMPIGDLVAIKNQNRLASMIVEMVKSYGPMIQGIIKSCDFDRNDITALVSTILNYVTPPHRSYLKVNRIWVENEMDKAMKELAG